METSSPLWEKLASESSPQCLKSMLVINKLKVPRDIVFYKMVGHGVLELEVTRDCHFASGKCLSMLPRISLSYLCHFLRIWEITAPDASSMIFHIDDESKAASKPHGCKKTPELQRHFTYPVILIHSRAP